LIMNDNKFWIVDLIQALVGTDIQWKFTILSPKLIMCDKKLWH
jgi:hypothetical protein